MLGFGRTDAVVLVHELGRTADQTLRVALAVHLGRADHEIRVEPGRGRRVEGGLDPERHAGDRGQDGVALRVPDLDAAHVAPIGAAVGVRGVGIGLLSRGRVSGQADAFVLAHARLARCVAHGLAQDVLGVAVLVELSQVRAMLGQRVLVGRIGDLGVPGRIHVVGDGEARCHLEVLAGDVVDRIAAGDHPLGSVLDGRQLALQIGDLGFLVVAEHALDRVPCAGAIAGGAVLQLLL